MGWIEWVYFYMGWKWVREAAHGQGRFKMSGIESEWMGAWFSITHFIVYFVMSHTHLERIYILWLLNCQEIPCSGQLQYRKTNRLQWDSKKQPLMLQTNNQPFSQTQWMFTYKLSGCGFESLLSHIFYYSV